MSKPVSLWQFERVLALATLIETGTNLANIPYARRVLQDVAPIPELAWASYLGLLISAVGFGVIIWYFIIKRASNAARIAYSFMVILTIFDIWDKTFHPIIALPWYILALFVIMQCVRMYAVWLLWRPDSREWFAKGIGNAKVPLRHAERYRDLR